MTGFLRTVNSFYLDIKKRPTDNKRLELESHDVAYVHDGIAW